MDGTISLDCPVIDRTMTIYTAHWTEAAYGERWSFTSADEKEVRAAPYRLGSNPLPGSIHFTQKEIPDA